MSSSVTTTTTAAAATVKQVVIPHITTPTPTALGDGGQPFLPSPVELALPGTPLALSSSGRGSRPPTAGGPTTSATTDLPSSSSFARTTLPPLSSVVPQSLAAPGGPTVLPALQSGGGVRRPTTASRPGTAPAAYLSSRHSFGGGLGGGSGLAPITEFSVPHSGRGGFAHYPEQLGGGAYAAYDASRGGGGGGPEREYPPSPPDGSGLSNDSPFSFHPPSLADPAAISRECTLGSDSSDGGSSDDDAFRCVGG